MLLDNSIERKQESLSFGVSQMTEGNSKNPNSSTRQHETQNLIGNRAKAAQGKTFGMYRGSSTTEKPLIMRSKGVNMPVQA